MSSQRIVARIRQLERENGRLLPADVIEAARDPDDPLHGSFTWDDTEAAQKFRLVEAGRLIKSVKLEITVRDVPLSVVSYVRDPELQTRDAGYRNVLSVRSEEDSARAAIVAEMMRVAAAVKRAKSLALVLGLETEIAQIDSIAHGVVSRVSLGDTPAGPAQ